MPAKRHARQGAHQRRPTPYGKTPASLSSWKATHGRSHNVTTHPSPHERDGVLISIDIGGSGIKVVHTTVQNGVIQHPVKLQAQDPSTKSICPPPALIAYDGEKVRVGFEVTDKTASGSLAHAKRIAMEDRNTPADMETRSNFAKAIGKAPSDVKVEDWIVPIVKYIIQLLRQDRSFPQNSQVLDVSLSVVNGTPGICKNLMRDAVRMAFVEEGINITGQVWVIPEAQCSLQELSQETGLVGSFDGRKLIIVVDIGGSTCDMVGGCWDANRKSLRTRYCAISLVYGGVDLEARANEILDLRAGGWTNTEKSNAYGKVFQLAQAVDDGDGDRFEDILQSLVYRAPHMADRIREDMKTAIHEYRHKIMVYTKEEIQKVLEAVSPEDRSDGVVACLVGQGSGCIKKLLERGITEVLQSENVFEPPSFVTFSNQEAWGVVKGANSILQDLAQKQGRVSRYEHSYGYKRRWKEKKSFEDRFTWFIEKGEPLFPGEEHVHLLHVWSDEGPPSLPYELEIYQFSEHEREYYRREPGQRPDTGADVDDNESGPMTVGVLSFNKEPPSHAFQEDQSEPEQSSDEEDGDLEEPRQPTKKHGCLLEYQLLVKIEEGCVKARAQTAGFFSADGELVRFDLGQWEPSTKFLNEDA